MRTSQTLEKKKRNNKFFFYAIVVIAVLYFGISMAVGSNNYQENDYFKTEEYAEFYIHRVGAFLHQEEELIENFQIFNQGDQEDKKEETLGKLQELEREKYLFYRKYYRAPAGFTAFQADSYSHTLGGFNAITKYDYKYSHDISERQVYEKGKAEFYEFVDKASSLKSRFEENVKVYKISKKNKEEAPLDYLEDDLEKDSLK